MGFPVGYTYTEVSLPSLVLNTLSLLGLFRGFLLSLLHALGLSSILEPAPPSPNRPFPSPHALLIRDRLPIMRFSDALESSTALLAERCTVCLHEFRDGEEVRWPINCRHIFHRSCLDGWIDQDHRTCPLCRAHLLGPHLVHDLRQPLVFPVIDLTMTTTMTTMALMTIIHGLRTTSYLAMTFVIYLLS